MKVWVVSRDYCAIHVFDNVEAAERYCKAHNAMDSALHNGASLHHYRTQEFDVEHS